MLDIDELPEIRDKYLAIAKKLGAINPELTSSGDEGDEMYYQLEAEGMIASGFLSYYPNCCGVGVLHSAQADDDIWLKFIYQLREEIAKACNWGLIQQTDIVNNPATARVMRSLRWRTAERAWFNPNSGNQVTLWTKRISQPRPKLAKSS